MATTFRLNHAGMARLLTSEFMKAEMAKRGVKVLAAAIASAPVMEDGPHPGRYKASIHMKIGIKKAEGDYGPTERAVARIIADAPEARWVEYGTKHNDRHRTLGHALDAASL